MRNKFKIILTIILVSLLTNAIYANASNLVINNKSGVDLDLIFYFNDKSQQIMRTEIENLKEIKLILDRSKLPINIVNYTIVAQMKQPLKDSKTPLIQDCDILSVEKDYEITFDKQLGLLRCKWESNHVYKKSAS